MNEPSTTRPAALDPDAAEAEVWAQIEDERAAAPRGVSGVEPAGPSAPSPPFEEIRVAPPVTLAGIWPDLLIHTRERKGRPWAMYALHLLATALLSSGFHMMLLYRVGAFLHDLRLRPLCIVVEKVIYHWYYCCIPCSVKMGPGIWVPHPLGIVFSSRARLGRNVWVRQHTQIVHVWEGFQSGVVGDNARLNTGCKLIKGAVIGHNAIVAAGALVNKTVPPAHMALGLPCQVRPLRPEQVPVDRPRHL
jgi:serine O-acetyltransferase